MFTRPSGSILKQQALYKWNKELRDRAISHPFGYQSKKFLDQLKTRHRSSRFLNDIQDHRQQDQCNLQNSFVHATPAVRPKPHQRQGGGTIVMCVVRN
jgi:hypothetical protein